MSAYPKIREAIAILAGDMGLINRDDPHVVDNTMLTLEAELKPEYLVTNERFLASLPTEALTIACIGENADRAAILPPDAEGFLNTIYDALTGNTDAEGEGQ